MGEVESLNDLPEYKADRTMDRHGTTYYKREGQAGTALHHYHDLGGVNDAPAGDDDEHDAKLGHRGEAQ